MNREQAINYLKSSGMSDKQIKAVIDAFTCEDWYDVPSDEMTLEQARQAVKDLRKKLTEYLEQQPSEDAEDKYDLGYICGYTDAMSDIAESEEV